jgi:hypothetical protein
MPLSDKGHEEDKLIRKNLAQKSMGYSGKK